MGFFEELNAACDARNAELDRLYEEQQAQAIANRAQEEVEEKTRRRNWAVGVLEAGNMPLEKKDKVSAAMMIVVTDPEIPCNEVERMLLKHGHYRSVIHQKLVEKFLERGGDPAGELGVYCIKQALTLTPDTDLFKGDVAQSLAMALLVLGRFNSDKRPEVAGAYALLRKMFPFVKNGNLQAIPHGLGAKLYPEHYKEGGTCIYRFASRFEVDKPRKVNGRPQPRHDRPEDYDKDIQAGMDAAESGQLSGIRLIRTGTD